MTGFTASATVNGAKVTPEVAGDVITISGLVSGDNVALTVQCTDDTTKTATAEYTVA